MEVLEANSSYSEQEELVKNRWFVLYSESDLNRFNDDCDALSNTNTHGAQRVFSAASL